MSSILYYSNFCEHSKKLLQTLSKTQVSKDIHFICIDKRVKDQTGKIQIVLENGQKIVMPENVTKVPALLLLNQNYQVLYGDGIYNHLKPRQEVVTRQATSNNMEPMAFSLGGGGFCGCPWLGLALVCVQCGGCRDCLWGWGAFVGCLVAASPNA